MDLNVAAAMTGKIGAGDLLLMSWIFEVEFGTSA
jgi:hypothetical protein